MTECMNSSEGGLEEGANGEGDIKMIKIGWYVLGTGEMAQQLRALSALAEDLGSIPSTHMVANNHM